jgi:raffinose/stachyose/melibiose transport system permease protein
VGPLKRRKPTVGRIITFIIMGIFAVLCVYPIIWLLINSLKTNAELFSNPWGFPAVPQWVNYEDAIIHGRIGRFFINSIFVTLISCVIAIILSAMTAYGITRLNWRLSGTVALLFTIGLSIPSYAAIIPLFYMLNYPGLLSSYVGVIIAHIVFALPMSVFIMSGFYKTIPRELEEAAIIDGCSVFGCFFRIIWPVSGSSIVTVAVIDFINIWNDLLFPQIFISNGDMQTLPVGLTMFADMDAVNYVGLLAAVVFTIVPTIIVYIILHDKIIEGMTMGAVKG